MIIAICDDEYKDCERIKEHVEEYSKKKDVDLQIEIYNPVEFKKLIEKIEDNVGEKNFLKENAVKENTVKGNVDPETTFESIPDIVIMDIEFTDVDYDGIVLVKRLNRLCKNTQIIYLTHILEFAPDVYETDHCYFVMKNNMEVMLSKAMDKAVTIYTAKKRQRPLEIMSEGHKVYIEQEKICYIEKRQRQTIVHTTTDSFSCYDSITSIIKKLSDNVVRCHGGFLVNLSHVTYLGGEKIILDVSDIEIPVGKTYREQAKQAYLKYWMQRM